MISLENYGWNHFHEQYYQVHQSSDLSVGRVISIKGFKYNLITVKGEAEAELSGKLLYGVTQEDLPKVGDWVFYKDYDAMGYIISVFPRKNELARRDPGERTQRQILAANIDCALVVQGLDMNFNIMRLDRYLVQLAACNIPAVVILNKADLVEDIEIYRKEVEKLGRDCPVLVCSTYTSVGIDKLTNAILGRGKTFIMIGSSGVGKSSLLNQLLRQDIQRTSDIGGLTGKGKHTTTSRDLFQLVNGSLLIDTPGMREFGVTAEEGGNSMQLFPLIEKFEGKCRFADCTHIHEQDCAVLRALNSGELDADVYESYRKLLKEQRRFGISAEDKKRMGKQFGKMTREAKNYRKKYKY